MSVSCLFDQLYKVGPLCVRYAKIARARQLEGEWFTLGKPLPMSLCSVEQLFDG